MVGIDNINNKKELHKENNKENNYKIEYRYFQKAKEVSKISDFSKPNIGCIAVYHNNIIGIGFNTNKTHPKQKYYNRYRELDYEYIDPVPKLHAEIMCINQISKLDIDYSKVELYIYRGRKDIGVGMTRPCPGCMRAIKDLGIRNIYYTTDAGYAYEKLA